MQRENGITPKELKYQQAIFSLCYKFKIMYIFKASENVQLICRKFIC